MLKSKILVCALVAASPLYAQINADSLYQAQQQKIVALEQAVQNAEQKNAIFTEKLNKLQRQIQTIEKGNKATNEAINLQQQRIDSLGKVVTINSTNIKTTADTLGIKIQSTNVSVLKNANDLEKNTIWGIVIVVITLIVSLVVAYLLHKKGQKMSDDKIIKLKSQADDLNEKIVKQFAAEAEELKNIGDAIKSTSGSNGNTIEPDHSLVKTIADRITFMEMTLYKMDSSVRGHKQLSKSIAQMKDNLLANGYEIVDMLGKEYDEGMKVTANFIEDESLAAGKQIITGIIKPQINYKGVMIQSAQITVSQN